MFGSAVLDTAIGIVLIFAVTALLASGITEFISNYFQLRAKYLLTGLRRLLDGSASTAKVRADGKKLLTTVKDLAEGAPDAASDTTPTIDKVLSRPTVQSAVAPRSWWMPGDVRFPSYLSSKAFRVSLLDTLLPGTADPDESSRDLFARLSTGIAKVPESRARSALQSFLKEAQGDVAAFETSIETWYDDQMARVSGWYKRYTQLILAGVGLVAAIVFNIDTLQVGHALWENEPVRTAVASAVANGTICQDGSDSGAKITCPTDQLESLKASGLPLGWSAACAPFEGMWSDCFTWEPGTGSTVGSVVLKMLGLLLTALAVSFGAPFWFDALSRLVSLRSAGAKPSDSSG